MSTSTIDLPPLRNHAWTQQRRVWIAGFAMLGLLVASYLSAYLIELHDLRVCTEGGGCQTILLSPRTRILGVAPPFIGMIAYGIILLVALRGLHPAHRDSAAVSRALGWLGLLALAFAIYNTAIELLVVRAVCALCLVCCAAAIAIFALSFPEFGLRRAARER